jgi:hypothetical protein
MASLTPELIGKAKTAKSAEELRLLAKENGIQMTAEEAATYFEQVNANQLDDDLLDGVSGGWLILLKDAIGTEESTDTTSSSKSQCS